MLKLNPYNKLGVVTDPAEFKGQRQLLTQIVGGLPQNYTIHGEPQTGKSSLLRFLANAEGAEALVPAAPRRRGWLPVLIDLDFLPENSNHTFWRFLFDRLSDQCRALGLESEGMRRVYEEATATRQLYDIQQTALTYMKRLDRDVVILLDNFDVVIEKFPEEEANATMGKLRAACQQQGGSDIRVCVILTTKEPLFVLCERRDLPRAEWSPLHSILEYAPLEPLDAEGSSALVEGPWRDSPEGSPFDDAEKNWVLQLAGGHPALLKRTCYRLLKAKEAGRVDFDRLRDEVESDPQVSVLLDLLWERVGQAESWTNLPLKSALAALARGDEVGDRAASNVLLLKGLAVEVGGRPRIASRILADFVKSQTKPGTDAAQADAARALHRPVPEIRMDEARQTVELQGRKISLTTLEFKLFRHLVENARRPCSREEIIKVLWDKMPPISGSKDDALEHIVKRLRRKVEVDHRNPRLILSIWKQGYLFHNEEAGSFAGESDEV